MLKKSQCNISLAFGFLLFAFLEGWNGNQLHAEEVPSASEAGNQLNLEKWPYNFTQEQITRLQSIGCTFSKDDLQVAQRLSNRGFSAEEYVQAYVETNRIRPGEQKQYAEAMAAFIYLGLPASEFSYFSSWGTSVTNYYNWRIGGTGNLIAGWVMTGVGLTLALTGIVVFAASFGEESSHDYYNSDGYTNHDARILGYTFMGIGGALVIIGLPIAIIGHVKKSHRAPYDLLDSGTKNEMQPYRLSEGDGLRAEESTSTTGIKWGLTPYYSKDRNWGLVFALNF